MFKLNSAKKSVKSKKVAKKVKPTVTIKQKKDIPIFEKSFLSGRYWVLFTSFFVMLVALVARATYVQGVDADRYINEGNKRTLRQENVSAMRGSILDRNGNELSVSVPMYTIVADPKEMIEKGVLSNADVMTRLAEQLELSRTDLLKKVERNPRSRHLYLARQISQTKADYIKTLKIAGIHIRQEPRRFYLKAEEMAHLIGYTNIDGQGIEGIEKSFNALLIGKPGSRTYHQARGGRKVEDLSDVKKYDAQNVTLSVDAKLQSMVYATLKKAVADNKAKSGTAVLVDIHTGEVLAMANAPSYNPHKLSGVVPELKRNRAITDTFEPGSTVKPFVVLAALQHRVVGRHAVINTGPFKLNGYDIRDVAPRDKQTLDEILENSSNRGVSRLALLMPERALLETYRQIGFSKPTNLGLIGEMNGRLEDRTKWSDIDRATISYGYGVTVTPLQLVRAYATLGSYGLYRPLSITKVDPPIIGERVFPEKVSREVVNMLEKVAIKNGRAMVDGYRVGIKTGTARKVENGKYVEKYLAFTAGIAPISNPRYALVVLIDEPTSGQYYGGAVSAPVFSDIMGYALRLNNIAPDRIDGTNPVKRTVRLSDGERQSVN